MLCQIATASQAPPLHAAAARPTGTAVKEFYGRPSKLGLLGQPTQKRRKCFPHELLQALAQVERLASWRNKVAEIADVPRPRPMPTWW